MWISRLLIAAGAVLMLAAPLPVLAQAGGRVICDVKVMRLVHTLKDRAGDMSAQELDTARRALYKAISECRPVGSSHSGGGANPAADPGAEGRKRVQEGVAQDRQSLRMQENVLTKPELREGETRLDSIHNKAQTDPYIAREMQKQWQVDQSLSTINRPIPGSPNAPKEPR